MKHSSAHQFILIVGLVQSLVVPVGGQELVEACPQCTVRMTPLVVLGKEEGMGALGSPGIALMRRNGEWIVTDYQDAGRLRLYSRSGTFLRLLSRKGQGPAEFQFVFDMAEVAGDSVYFIDQGNLRLAVRDQLLRPVRTMRLPVPAERAAFFQDGSFVTATGPWPRQAGPRPLAYVSARGELVAPLGEAPEGTDMRDTDRWRRAVITLTDSTVLVAELTEYVLREWSVHGRMLRQLQRKVPWFQPSDHFGGHGDYSEPPGPGVVALERDPSGLVWVMIKVPDPHWDQGVGPGRDPYGRSAQVITNPERYWDTVLDVVDPNSWNVLASYRVDEPLDAFAGPGVVYGRGTTELGIPIIRSWKVALVRSARGGSDGS